MLRNWQQIIEAISPGQSRHLATAKNAEGWLFRAWKLDRCPRITTRRIYRDDARSEFLTYPFTIEELHRFLVPSRKAERTRTGTGLSVNLPPVFPERA